MHYAIFCAGVSMIRSHMPDYTEISNTPAGSPVWMAIADTIETGLSLVKRLWEAGYSFVAVLIRFFHDTLGHHLQRLGLAVDRCRSGGFPNIWQVYVPDACRDRFRLTGDRFFPAAWRKTIKNLFLMHH
jgi:hypothetical protein